MNSDPVCLESLTEAGDLYAYGRTHLGVDDEDEGAGSREDHVVVERGVKEVHLTGEVPDLEVDEGAPGEVVLVDLVGALEEERLVGRHLVENHLSKRTPPRHDARERASE